MDRQLDRLLDDLICLTPLQFVVRWCCTKQEAQTWLDERTVPQGWLKQA